MKKTTKLEVANLENILNEQFFEEGNFYGLFKPRLIEIIDQFTKLDIINFRELTQEAIITVGTPLLITLGNSSEIGELIYQGGGKIKVSINEDEEYMIENTFVSRVDSDCNLLFYNIDIDSLLYRFDVYIKN